MLAPIPVTSCVTYNNRICPVDIWAVGCLISEFQAAIRLCADGEDVLFPNPTRDNRPRLWMRGPNRMVLDEISTLQYTATHPTC